MPGTQTALAGGRVKAGFGGGKAIDFNTITISEGTSMGSEGMKYSLVYREVIADSIETVVGCGGTILPGCLTSERSADGPRPQQMEDGEASGGCNPLSQSDALRAGTARAPGRELDVVSVFEAIGQHATAGAVDRAGHC